MQNKDISVLVYGAGGHAKVVLDCLIDSETEVIAFFDDDPNLVSINGYDVLGEYDPTVFPEHQLVIGIGHNEDRRAVAAQIKHRFSLVKHPSAQLSKYAFVKEGTVLFHNSVVQSGSSVGKHCIVNTSATIDYECQIGDFVHIAPRVCLCSGVRVGNLTHIGAGAIVLPQVKIGQKCVIGAGAVITHDIPDSSVVVGVPGKVIKTLG